MTIDESSTISTVDNNFQPCDTDVCNASGSSATDFESASSSQLHNNQPAVIHSGVYENFVILDEVLTAAKFDLENEKNRQKQQHSSVVIDIDNTNCSKQIINSISHATNGKTDNSTKVSKSKTTKIKNGKRSLPQTVVGAFVNSSYLRLPRTQERAVLSNGFSRLSTASSQSTLRTNSATSTINTKDTNNTNDRSATTIGLLNDSDEISNEQQQERNRRLRRFVYLVQLIIIIILLLFWLTTRLIDMSDRRINVNNTQTSIIDNTNMTLLLFDSRSNTTMTTQSSKQTTTDRLSSKLKNTKYLQKELHTNSILPTVLHIQSKDDSSMIHSGDDDKNSSPSINDNMNLASFLPNNDY